MTEEKGVREVTSCHIVSYDEARGGKTHLEIHTRKDELVPTARDDCRSVTRYEHALDSRRFKGAHKDRSSAQSDDLAGALDNTERPLRLGQHETRECAVSRSSKEHLDTVGESDGEDGTNEIGRVENVRREDGQEGEREEMHGLDRPQTDGEDGSTREVRHVETGDLVLELGRSAQSLARAPHPWALTQSARSPHLRLVQ